MNGPRRLDARALEAMAREAGFDVVGFTPARALPRGALIDWLEAGHHADMGWMAAHLEERLDVTRLFPPARTVMALACNYWHGGLDESPIARYARGRDYHATLKIGSGRCAGACVSAGPTSRTTARSTPTR